MSTDTRLVIALWAVIIAWVLIGSLAQTISENRQKAREAALRRAMSHHPAGRRR